MSDGYRAGIGLVLEPDSIDHIKVQEAGDEMLLNPKDLAFELSSLADRYATLTDEDGNLLTPVTTISLGNEDEGPRQEHIVQLGRLKNSRKEAIVFIIGPTSGDHIEWLFSNGFGISDGKGTITDTIEGQKFVRTVLDALEENFAIDVVNHTDEFDINAYLTGEIRERIAANEAERVALEELESVVLNQNESTRKFRVTIHNVWSKEGRRPIDEDISADSLAEAVQIAASKFKEINDGLDMQATNFSVSAYVDGQMLLIPAHATAALFRSLSH